MCLVTVLKSGKRSRPINVSGKFKNRKLSGSNIDKIFIVLVLNNVMKQVCTKGVCGIYFGVKGSLATNSLRNIGRQYVCYYFMNVICCVTRMI